MTKLEKKLRASLRQLAISKQDRILVAVSGGADSTALLDALARWKKSEHLFAAHLNHLLRGAESNEDETFVRAITRHLNVPIFVAQENVAAYAIREKKNLEAVARRLRYDFLLRTAEQCQSYTIVTAHTQDDQVETILMRLLRGTSAAGLQGIEVCRELSATVRLVRPMLEITRAEVLAHCAQYELSFRHDSSNDSAEFTRNRIRHELLPLLQSFNPDFTRTLLRTASQLHEDDAYLQAEAAGWVDELVEDQTLNFKPLLGLAAALRRRILRLWIERTRGDLRRISTAHLIALDGLILHGEGGRYIELPGGWRVFRRGTQLNLKLQPFII
ncbi:MAG TPA: tRNA lysidine(34) synthetase TilS [Blastocatellia bacterium]|nr:tRNA lysidine(34) synthetase TilS [Blastocatellia bacterium]